MTTRWMLFDQQRCFGCNACVVACQQEYGLPAQVRFNRVELELTGATRTNLDLNFKPMVCAQCDNAPCMAICPVNAITRETDGVVTTNRATCVGCRLCTTAAGCPYGMRSMDGVGKAVKCDFCRDRITLPGETPYCVKTCPSGARQLITSPTPPTGTPLGSLGGALPKVFYGSII